MIGYLLLLAAGILQGSFMLPMKFTRKWAWENTWLVFAFTAYLIWPWMLALLTVPHLGSILAVTGARSLILVLIFGIAWGAGTVTFGLGVDMLGLALGYAIIIGLAASAGALIPMIVLSPEKLGQAQGLLTVVALVLVLIGVALCSLAGKMHNSKVSAEAEIPRSSYALGLVICIASGLLSSSGNLGFTFGSEVIQRAIEHGVPESMAGNSLWALITIPLFICNSIYCIWLLRKHRTGSRFSQHGTQHYWALAALMGFMWMAGFVCYAPGARRMGPLGSSVGWAIMMSTMIITANLWGFWTGEWKGANGKTYRFLCSGVAVLILAICVVGYANHQ